MKALRQRHDGRIGIIFCETMENPLDDSDAEEEERQGFADGNPGLTYSDRQCSPEETFRRIEPLLPRYGITRLARLTGLDRIGIPVWNAVSPNARSITISQGKGVTDIDAKVSAAMEALERAVAGGPEIEPVCTSYAVLTAAGNRASCLPALIGSGQADIEPDEVLEWVIGTDLIDGGQVHVPLQAATLDHTLSDCRFWQSSDGLASGNTFEEAVLHGLLERVERDAYALWQVGSPESRAVCCVEPASLEDPVIDEMERRITEAGLALRLFDMTTDIGIPSYTVLLASEGVITARAARFLDVTHGSGTHPDRARAAIRAVTEAAQSRLTFISGARDDINPDSFERMLPEEIRAQFLAKPRRKSARPDLGHRTSDLLVHTVGRLRTAGVQEAIAVRLTKPNGAFAVAKVFVPQLENPEGRRKRRHGARAIGRSLMAG